MRSLIFLVLLSCVVLGGCNSKSGQDETETSGNIEKDSTAAFSDINSNQSQLFKTVIGDHREGIFRGISFGDTFDKVRATETFGTLEDTTDHIGFTLDTPQLETIDVLYYHSAGNQLVNKIAVDIYLNSMTSVENLWDECKNHFNATYGKPGKVTSDTMIWENQKVKVTLINASKAVDYGLKLSFEPLTPGDVAMNL